MYVCAPCQLIYENFCDMLVCLCRRRCTLCVYILAHISVPSKTQSLVCVSQKLRSPNSVSYLSLFRVLNRVNSDMCHEITAFQLFFSYIYYLV